MKLDLTEDLGTLIFLAGRLMTTIRWLAFRGRSCESREDFQVIAQISDAAHNLTFLGTTIRSYSAVPALSTVTVVAACRQVAGDLGHPDVRAALAARPDDMAFVEEGIEALNSIAAKVEAAAN